jgi:hypothetical protein
MAKIQPAALVLLAAVAAAAAPNAPVGAGTDLFYFEGHQLPSILAVRVLLFLLRLIHLVAGAVGGAIVRFLPNTLVRAATGALGPARRVGDDRASAGGASAARTPASVPSGTPGVVPPPEVAPRGAVGTIWRALFVAARAARPAGAAAAAERGAQARRPSVALKSPVRDAPALPTARPPDRPPASRFDANPPRCAADVATTRALDPPPLPSVRQG